MPPKFDKELNQESFLALVESVGKLDNKFKTFDGNYNTLNQQLEDKFANVTTSINTLKANTADQTLRTDAAMIAGGAGTPGGIPQGSVTIFRGRQGEDFHSWSELFELVFNAVGYEDDKKARLLPAYLRDNALQRYKVLTDDTKRNWGQLKTALTAALKPAEQARFARCKLADCTQKEDETVQDFSVRLEKLVKISYPTFTNDQQKDILLAHFVSKLRPEIRGWVTAFEPKDYESAVSKAATIEANRRLDSGTYVHPRILALGPDRTEGDSYTDFESKPQIYYTRAEENNTQFQNNGPGNSNFRQPEPWEKDNEFLKEKMCELMLEVKRIGSTSHQSSSNTDRRDQKCFYCGKLGHWKPECRLRLSQKPRQTSQYNGPHKQWQDRRPTPRINVMEQKSKPKSTDLSQDNEEVNAEIKSLRDQNKRLQERLWPNDPATVQINSLRVDNLPKNSDKKRRPLFVQKADQGRDKKETKHINSKQFMQSHRETTASGEKDDDNNVSSKEIRDPKRALTKTGLVSMAIAAVILLMCFAKNVQAAPHTDRVPEYPAPMICSSSGSKAFWELPKPIPCGKTSHEENDTVQAVRFEIYKHEIIQQRITGHACQITHQHSDTFVYFLGWDHWRQDSTKMETVSFTECMSMIQHKRCTHGPLVDESDYWITQNKHNAGWGNWHFKCCQTHTTDTYNCAFHEVILYKRRNSPYMESSVGDVSGCKWKEEHCTLPEGTMLIWKKPEGFACEYILHATVNGKRLGNSIITLDGTMAFTFSKHKHTVMGCRERIRNEVMMTDQGIPIRIIQEVPLHPIVHIENTEAKRHKRATTGMVEANQLAAQMQALEITTRQNIQFTFHSVMSSTCVAMNAITQALFNTLMYMPTIGARILLGTPNLYARSSSSFLEVFSCQFIPKDSYRFLPQNESCTDYIPIEFELGHKNMTGYLDAQTLIIHDSSMEQECRLVTTRPLFIDGQHYLYMSNTGELEVINPENIPEMPHLLHNMTYKLHLRTTIFHELIMNNFSSFQSRITLSDIAKSVTWQRKLFSAIGLDQKGNPTGDEAIGAIVNKGYWAFLRGILPVSPWQLWTFIVCLEVTLITMFRLCCPIRIFDLISECSIPTVIDNGRKFVKIKRENSKKRLDTDSESTTSVRFYKQRRADQPKPTEIRVDDKLVDTVTDEMPPATPKLEFSWPKIQIVTTDQSKKIEGLGTAQIPITVNGILVVGLLDSGAHISVASKELLPAFGIKEIEHSQYQNATSLTGHKVPIIGCVELTLSFGSCIDVTQKIQVVENSDYEMIIGVDVMQSIPNLTLDFKNKRLRLPGGSIPMGAPDNMPKAVKVCLLKKEIIPARSQVVIACQPNSIFL